jgi:hypothetical protein
MTTDERKIYELKKKVAELEYQTKYLYEKLAIDIPEAPVYGLTPEIMYQIQRGKENEAIKLFMKETDEGYKMAMVFLESFSE